MSEAVATRPPRLIALSPGTLSAKDGGRFLAALGAALEAGLPGLLLREPRLADADYLALGAHVRELLDQRGASTWFALHDRTHLAAELGADAVHLGHRSLAPADARPLLAEGVQVGLSTHAGDDPLVWEHADYLFHGPLHRTASKPGVEPIGLEGLERAVERARVPLLALGGVTSADVGPARAAGAHGVAVLSGILGSADPASATRAFLGGLA